MSSDAGRPPRPEVIPVDSRGIPDELTEYDNWVCWRYEWREPKDEDKPGKWTKVPINPHTDGRASSTEPETWASAATALGVHRRDGTQTDGIGFVFTDTPFTGIDGDDCINPATGEIADWFVDVLETMDSPAFVSPSETGGHIYAECGKPGSRCKRAIGGADGEIEMYDTGRFFTVTGVPIDGYADKPIRSGDGVETPLAAVYAKYLERSGQDTDDTATAAGGSVAAEKGTVADSLNTGTVTPTGTTTLADKDLIGRAKDADDGGLFARLWDGSTGGYKSHSEADGALVMKLAFWSDGDRAQIDCLFRQSGLMRDKWDEDRGSETYGERTIRTALEEQNEFYGPASRPAPTSASDGGTASESTTTAETETETVTVPGLTERNGGYARVYTDDGETRFQEITNFTIEVRSYLTHEDGATNMALTVHPRGGESSYETTVEPAVFNEKRNFKNAVVTGRTTKNELVAVAAVAPDIKG